ncbi:unnamed protein product [Rhodiola kirilowii]
MGRGRTPCCDKCQVKKGPWSSAEDLRLISYIKMYGHDNWRALPKRAGLLRCGKSCRLRWVNYLHPGVKRGNLTKEEEDTIVRLHQAFGNKWSKIAAYLPGRTDNGIKNVWNTYLKKRQTQRPAASREDVTTESTMMTFSSSSSNTVESTQHHQMVEVDGQINIFPDNVSVMMRAEMEPYKTTFAPNQRTVANQVLGLQDSESYTDFGFISQHSDQFVNPSGIDQLEDFTMWEDPNLLESLLGVEKYPNWALPHPNIQPDLVQNNLSNELLMGHDFDVWSMLDYDVIPPPAKPDDKPADNAPILEAPMSAKNMNAAAQEHIIDKDIDSLLEFWENEPELARISTEMCEKPGQFQGDYLQQSNQTAATGYYSKEIPNMDYFPMWPPSPGPSYFPSTSETWNWE